MRIDIHIDSDLRRKNLRGEEGGGHCHIQAIQVCATVEGVYFLGLAYNKL